MSRSKRKKKTKLCHCGERIEMNSGNRAAHDMCDRLKPKNKAKKILAEEFDGDRRGLWKDE